MVDRTKEKLVAGTLWTLVGHAGLIAINLATNIFLARLLTPKEYGRLGIIMFFISLARVLSESGLGGALVRNKKVREIDYQTIFTFNLFISLIFNLILIISSKFISNFYSDHELQYPIIGASFILIINAFQFIQNAKTLKYGLYKQRAIFEIIATIIGSLIAILSALRGLGIWSLIFHQVVTSLVLTGLFVFYGEGITKISFEFKSLREHMQYGINTTSSSLLNTFFDNINQAILGKYFSISHTGNYFQAKKFQGFFGGILNRLFLGVFFSEMSELQDNKILLKKIFSKILKYISVILGYCTFLILLFTDEIIVTLIGIKWIDSAYFLKILILIGFFQIQENAFKMLFKIFDKTFDLLILDLFKKILTIFVICAGVYFLKLDIIMIGLFVVSFISYFLNVYFTAKILSISMMEDVINVLKISFCCIVVYVLYIKLFQFESLGIILIFLTILYFLSALLFRLLSINEIKDFIYKINISL